MLESKFLGKEFASRPRCPFCGVIIDRPKELSTRRQGEMPVGICSCGATYACDETGHNQGSAMIEALVFGCDMDWDLAWGLLPEEDYIQEMVETYDYKNHLIVHGGFFEGRRIAGILFFQTIVSIGMNVRILPVTGLTLPFVSYGGSSLVTLFLAIGIVESVLMRQHRQEFG